KTARSGFSDVLIIHANGNSIAAPPAASRSASSARAPRRRAFGPRTVRPRVRRTGSSASPVAAPSGIDDPPLLQPQLHRRHDEDHGEQRPAHRGGVAHAPIAEVVLYDLLDDDDGRAGGTGCRHHPE